MSTLNSLFSDVLGRYGPWYDNRSALELARAIHLIEKYRGRLKSWEDSDAMSMAVYACRLELKRSRENVAADCAAWFDASNFRNAPAGVPPQGGTE